MRLAMIAEPQHDSEPRRTAYADVHRATTRAVRESRRAINAVSRSVALRDTAGIARRARLEARASEVEGRVRADVLEKLETLRRRELEVLVLYAAGLSTDEIAAALFVSRHTVRTHVKNALPKLDVHARRDAEQLIRFAADAVPVGLAAARVLPIVRRWPAASSALLSKLETFASGRRDTAA